MLVAEAFRPPTVDEGFSQLDANVVSHLSHAALPHVYAEGSDLDYAHTVVGSSVLADYYGGIVSAYRCLIRQAEDSGLPEPVVVCYEQRSGNLGADIGFVRPVGDKRSWGLRVDTGTNHSAVSRFTFDLLLNMGPAVVTYDGFRTRPARARPNNVLTIPVDKTVWSRAYGADSYRVAREPLHTAIAFGEEAFSAMPESAPLFPAYSEARRTVGRAALTVLDGSGS